MRITLTMGLLAAMLLSGCNSGGGAGGVTLPADDSFSNFAKALIGATSDTTDPEQINDRVFTFNEDATAFDDIL